MKKENGITLVALVVTIIVLLILAGVSLSMVFNSDGLFSRASGTANKYNKEKAKEALEIALRDAQLMKYGPEGLNDDQLDAKISEVGSLNTTHGSEVTADRWIWKIDRNVPKILDYIGESNGIVIGIQ